MDEVQRGAVEIINDDSWVMRDSWDTQVKIGKGLVTIQKKLTSVGVKRLMERAIWAPREVHVNRYLYLY
jgi:hypothetical protein